MRWAWVAGFVLVTVNLLNAAILYLFYELFLLLFPGFDSEVEKWSAGQFAWVVFESVLIGLLSYGVLKRVRLAAVSLFFYFWLSRIPLLALGLISLEKPPDDFARFLLLQALPAYLFFQGMRGAWTFHFLTHPPYPAEAPPIQETAA